MKRHWLNQLTDRFEQSRFQQAVYAWQDAHPAASDMLEMMLHAAMGVLFILGCLMLGLSVAVIVSDLRAGGLLYTGSLFLLIMAALVVWLGWQTLRNW